MCVSATLGCFTEWRGRFGSCIPIEPGHKHEAKKTVTYSDIPDAEQSVETNGGKLGHIGLVSGVDGQLNNGVLVSALHRSASSGSIGGTLTVEGTELVHSTEGLGGLLGWDVQATTVTNRGTLVDKEKWHVIVA